MEANHNKTVSPELREKLSKIKHVALDMDGTIYLGSTLFPFTKKFLSDMSESGIGYSFLTNNPSKSVADYLKKLEGLGIEADEENMYTTSLAAIDYIKAHYPEAKRLFLLGTPSMISQFEKAGFESCADDPNDVPDVLVVAFDMTLEYSRLCRAAWWASQGVPYIATNPDRGCPTEFGLVPDCFAMCEAINYATGRRPLYIGKPDGFMVDYSVSRSPFTKEETVVIGDRLYTDIASGVNAGVDTICVLSGESTQEDIDNSEIKPTYVFEDIKEILGLLQE